MCFRLVLWLVLCFRCIRRCMAASCSWAAKVIRKLQSGDDSALDIAKLHGDVLGLVCDLERFRRIAGLDSADLPEHFDPLQECIGESSVCRHLFAARLQVCNAERLRLAIKKAIGRIVAGKALDAAILATAKAALLEDVAPWCTEPAATRSIVVPYRGLPITVEAVFTIYCCC